MPAPSKKQRPHPPIQLVPHPTGLSHIREMPNTIVVEVYGDRKYSKEVPEETQCAAGVFFGPKNAYNTVSFVDSDWAPRYQQWRMDLTRHACRLALNTTCNFLRTMKEPPIDNEADPALVSPLGITQFLISSSERLLHEEFTCMISAVAYSPGRLPDGYKLPLTDGKVRQDIFDRLKELHELGVRVDIRWVGDVPHAKALVRETLLREDLLRYCRAATQLIFFTDPKLWKNKAFGSGDEVNSTPPSPKFEEMSDLERTAHRLWTSSIDGR